MPQGCSAPSMGLQRQGSLRPWETFKTWVDTALATVRWLAQLRAEELDLANLHASTER